MTQKKRKLNKEEKEELEEHKKKQKENEFWLKIIVLPLVVGFALVYAKLSMVLFKIIGWFFLVIGLIALSSYAMKHKEELKKIKNEFVGVFRRKK